MKKLLIIALFSLTQASCIEQERIRTRDKVVIDGDEIPGIGGTKEHPDSCIAYYNQKDHRVHIAYGNNKILDTVLRY